MELTRRRFSAFFGGLSLLLCAVIAVLWVRSYWRWDSVYWSDTHRQQQFTLCRGRVVYATTWFPNGCAAVAVRHPSGSRSAGLGFTWEDEANRASGRRVLGFEWAEYLSEHFQNSFTSFFVPPTRVVAVPCWAIFLATGGLAGRVARPPTAPAPPGHPRLVHPLRLRPARHAGAAGRPAGPLSRVRRGVGNERRAVG